MIRPTWVQFWDESDVISDASSPEQSSRHAPRDGYDGAVHDFVVLAIDPAVSQKRSADASALVTLGRNGRRVHCFEAISRRVAAPELVDLIDDADPRWQPDLILFEANAAFKGIKDLLTAHARFGSRAKEVVHSRDKFARVNTFGVRVQNGSFRLRGRGGVVDPSQQELLDEACDQWSVTLVDGIIAAQHETRILARPSTNANSNSPEC